MYEAEIAQDGAQVIRHSPSVVRKRMPGRTLSVDYRIVSDLRQINLCNRKEDLYPSDVVKLSDLVNRILKLQRNLPTFPVKMTKRDIASAFRGILLRPDSIRTCAADIPGEMCGGEADLFMGNLAMPVGWVDSPAYFKIHTDAIKSLRNHFRPGQSLMSGSERFDSFIYVDDCVLIECPLGIRFSACATCWEWRCKQILGEDSISVEKRDVEGRWSQQHTMLGFEINADNMAIRLPEEKVGKARSLILSAE